MHKNCFNFNRRTFLNYGFPETPENMLLDRLLCIYALMYKCSIKTVVIIEEVKKSDKVFKDWVSLHGSPGFLPVLWARHFVLCHLFKNDEIANTFGRQRLPPELRTGYLLHSIIKTSSYGAKSRLAYCPL